MPERRDYLTVCNDQGTPVTDFQTMFCMRCVQPECSRSKAASLFETRVTTWQDRLFVNPTRMPKDDPLYAAISAKRFIEIDVSRIPEIGGKSDWVDPRALPEAPPVDRPRPAKAARAPQLEVKADPPTVPSPAEPVRAPLNTAFAQGAMLAGGRTPAPKKDAWESSPAPRRPLEDSTPIVGQGARLKFTTGTGVVGPGKGTPK